MERCKKGAYKECEACDNRDAMIALYKTCLDGQWTKSQSYTCSRHNHESADAINVMYNEGQMEFAHPLICEFLSSCIAIWMSPSEITITMDPSTIGYFG